MYPVETPRSALADGGGPMCAVRARAPVFLTEDSLPPARSARRPTTICPTLCRVAAYDGPGLPRPMTACTAPCPAPLSPRRRGPEPRPPRPRPGPPRADLWPAGWRRPPRWSQGRPRTRLPRGERGRRR